MSETRDGEILSQRGDLFQKRIINFLLDYGFKEKFRFQNNLDFVGVTPIDTSFIKPFFCPKGIVAIDATTEDPAKKLDKILKNVQDYNSNVSEEERISGKIIVCDFKISDKIIKIFLEKKGVYVWDIRMLTFLTMKIFLRNIWLFSEHNIREIMLDEDSSFIFTIMEKPIGENAILNAAFFIENRNILQLNILAKKIRLLINKLKEECRIVLPIDVNLTIHILNDWIKCNDSDILTAIYNTEDEIVNLIEKDVRDLIFGYGSAPWASFTGTFI